MSNMRRPRPKNHVGRLAVFLIAVMIPIVCYALPTYSDHHPNTHNWVGKRFSNGANSWTTKATFSFKETTPNGTSTKYVSKTIGTSSSTLGKLARGALKQGKFVPAMVGAGLIVEGILEGAGWAINELNQQVTSGGIPGGEILPNGTYFYCSGLPGKYFMTVTTAITLCAEKYLYVQNGGQVVSIELFGVFGTITSYSIAGKNPNGQPGYSTLDISSAKNNSGAPMVGTGKDGAPVTDQQIGERVAAAPASDINELLAPGGNPQMTPELVAALNELKAAHAAETGQPAPTPIEVDPEYGQSQPEPAKTEWPGFCDWATPVCQFIEWVKTDHDEEPPPVPFEQEVVQTVAWNSGMGGGSCPSPESVTISVGSYNTTVQFGYETICTAMTYMKPVFLVMAAVMAAMMVGGFRESGGA